VHHQLPNNPIGVKEGIGTQLNHVFRYYVKTPLI
jgi:hypothetical protein